MPSVDVMTSLAVGTSDGCNVNATKFAADGAVVGVTGGAGAGAGASAGGGVGVIAPDVGTEVGVAVVKDGGRRRPHPTDVGIRSLK